MPKIIIRAQISRLNPIAQARSILLMPLLQGCWLLGWLLLVGQTLLADTPGTATIRGAINSPLAYLTQGAFHQKPIRFYFDNLLETLEFVEVPTALGAFEARILLPKPMPVLCEYDGQTTLLFLSPNDDIKMQFTGDNLTQTLRYEGKGAIHNQYCQQMYRQYGAETVENELRTRREQLSSRAAYMPLCENYKQREQTLLHNFLTQNPQSSAAFQAWAKAEANYRYATRMAAWYFRSDDKQNDDYKMYSQTHFILNDNEAVVSNRYLEFLDYHLRNLSMRDPEDLRRQREQQRLPWVLRAIELAQTELQGKAREYATAKLLIDLIMAEYADTPRLYEQFAQQTQDRYALFAVEKQYAQFRAFMNAEPPADAQLYIIDEDYALSFEALLAKYKGKVIYIDFWASWCAPCLSELPYSQTLQKYYAKQDLIFLYLTPDDIESKWRGNIARYQLSGEHYLMSKPLKDEALFTLGIKALPHYAIIDKQGNVAIADARKPSNVLLRDDLDRLLQP